MQLIDGHAHVGTWREPGFAGRGTTLDEAVSLYEGLGFAGALVTTTDTGDNDGLLADVERADGRLALRVAHWVDPTRAADRDALEQNLARSPRVAALKVHPSFLRRAPTEPDFHAYYRLAARHGLPVVIHCGRWREVAGFERVLELCEAHPDVNFVLSHMGGDEPLLVRGTVAAIGARGLTNAYLGTESLRQYWVVQEALDALGPERLVFGSDYNLNHPAAFLAVVRALRVDDAGLARIVGGNLDALLPATRRFHPPATPAQSEETR